MEEFILDKKNLIKGAVYNEEGQKVGEYVLHNDGQVIGEFILYERDSLQDLENREISCD